MIRRKLMGLATFAALAGLGLAAHAEPDYPSRPVKLIVPFPAGGTSDIMGRMLAEELSKALKQPFVVENISGAGGTVGAERAAKAAPDGYTLLLSGVGQNAVAHGLNPKLAYDSTKDFVQITQVHSGPNVLVVHPGTPFKTFKELVDHGMANAGKLSYGYTHASSGHMAMELLKQTVSTCTGSKTASQSCKGLFMVGIPYRGGGPMMTDLLGGQIPLMFINQDTALPYVKAGKLRALAVTSVQRNPLYPDVPSISELGYPGFSALSWSGLSAPKGTPQAIVDRLEAAAVNAMKTPAISARMQSQGFVVPPLGSAPYTQFVSREIDRWGRVIKIAGIKAE